MNIFLSSVEGWNTLFQAVSVILIAGTVLAGAGTIITDQIVSRNQARDLALANAEAAKANKGVADTGLEIAKAKEETARLRIGRFSGSYISLLPKREGGLGRNDHC